MKSSIRHGERGALSGLAFAVIGLSVLVLGLGVFSIWAYVAYSEANSDLESKLLVARTEAKAEQAEIDEEKFAQREKEPNTMFKAPDDYCGVRFMYPKTWSVYESERITNGGDYRAYLNPKVVPVISNSTQFALRVVIEQRDYDDVLQRYDNLISKGDLKQSSSSSNGQTGVRLSGNFSKNIRGEAVIYRCRSLTITVQTDADVFKNDFQEIVSTLDFNV